MPELQQLMDSCWLLQLYLVVSVQKPWRDGSIQVDAAHS
jgi:hypothetical protein